MNLPTFEEIMAAPVDIVNTSTLREEFLGTSREGRAIVGYRIGFGALRISLLAGCHADEPVGPRFLARLVGYLHSRPGGDDIIARCSWRIVPDINPDGAERNLAWMAGVGDRYNLAKYLGNVVREAPGDDIEFGFPRGPNDKFARPENTAVYTWWRGSATEHSPEPFHLHMSLHGMAFAGGPWFLIDPAWVERSEALRGECRGEVHRMGYKLHDVQRYGEKGFHRIERGFCTCPNSIDMSRYFLSRRDPDTAASFRPSSMEAARSLGGDPLTLVSEMPLFLLPGVGERVDPNDPEAEAWADRLVTWRARLRAGASIEDDVTAGILPMPIDHQMRLQWTFIRAGIRCVLDNGPDGGPAA
jgi:hypothetical protein